MSNTCQSIDLSFHFFFICSVALMPSDIADVNHASKYFTGHRRDSAFFSRLFSTASGVTRPRSLVKGLSLLATMRTEKWTKNVMNDLQICTMNLTRSSHDGHDGCGISSLWKPNFVHHIVLFRFASNAIRINFLRISKLLTFRHDILLHPNQAKLDSLPMSKTCLLNAVSAMFD